MIAEKVEDIAETCSDYAYVIEGLLGPIALSSLDQVGWDRFLEQHRKVYETTRHPSIGRLEVLKRDEHGMAVRCYKDAIDAALKRGWTLLD